MFTRTTALSANAYPQGYDPAGPLLYEDPSSMAQTAMSFFAAFAVISLIIILATILMQRGSESIKTYVALLLLPAFFGIMYFSISTSQTSYADDFPGEESSCDYGVQWAQDRYGVAVDAADCWTLFAKHSLRNTPDRVAYDTENNQRIDALETSNGTILIDSRTNEELPLLTED